MATIEKRVGKDGQLSYRVKIRRRGTRAISETFRRLTDTKAFARQTEADIESGRGIVGYEAKRHTFLTLKAIGQRYPYIPNGVLEWWMFHRETNGLAHAVIKIGRRVLFPRNS